MTDIFLCERYNIILSFILQTGVVQSPVRIRRPPSGRKFVAGNRKYVFQDFSAAQALAFQYDSDPFAEKHIFLRKRRQ